MMNIHRRSAASKRQGSGGSIHAQVVEQVESRGTHETIQKKTCGIDLCGKFKVKNIVLDYSENREISD